MLMIRKLMRLSRNSEPWRISGDLLKMYFGVLLGYPGAVQDPWETQLLSGGLPFLSRVVGIFRLTSPEVITVDMKGRSLPNQILTTNIGAMRLALTPSPYGGNFFWQVCLTSVSTMDSICMQYCILFWQSTTKAFWKSYD